MQNLLSVLKKETIPITLILILALSRLIPHPPNFTPIIAVAIMSGYFFKNIYLAFFTILISMLISDMFIGFYKNMFFVYTAMFLISFIFYQLSEKLKKFKNVVLFTLSGSLIFFIISNFGVWFVSNIYERTILGLVECYILAIPFFFNTIISTFLYLIVSKVIFDKIFVERKLAGNK